MQYKREKKNHQKLNFVLVIWHNGVINEKNMRPSESTQRHASRTLSDLSLRTGYFNVPGVFPCLLNNTLTIHFPEKHCS